MFTWKTQYRKNNSYFLATEISLLIAERDELKNWVELNWTLHGLLHHSVELIYLNGGFSLGSLSEEALESNNKFCRRFLEQYARQTSPVLQLTDAMTRLLERSDPAVQQHQKSTRICLVCSICGLRHKTSNHYKYEELLLVRAEQEDDSLVQEFLL